MRWLSRHGVSGDEAGKGSKMYGVLLDMNHTMPQTEDVVAGGLFLRLVCWGWREIRAHGMADQALF